MQIDIPAHIEKQLFLRDAVIIPGLGGFTATRTAAAVDYVGGAVTPPSKTLTFSENLTTDDGVLIQDIAQNHSISTEEARNVVTEFVEKTQLLLQQREIVTLAGIGRLYKNYVQKIQFLPDATNFNAESYGLPPLQFSPIARSREVTEAPPPLPVASPAVASTIKAPLSPADLPVPTMTVPANYEPTPDRSSTWVTALGIFLLLAALGMGIWYWQHQKMNRLVRNNQSEQPIADSPEKQAKKSKPNDREAAQVVETDVTDRTNESPAEAAAQKMQTAREAVQTNAAGRECILVVATLQDRINADRLVQKLKKDGHQVYFLQKNGYQVGIQFRYNKLAEVQERIIVLQNLTGEQNIWIKKK